jgi:hypothetical protein
MEKLELFTALLNQGYNRTEARNIICDMRLGVLDGLNPEELLEDYGLEPDYIFDIMPI